MSSVYIITKIAHKTWRISEAGKVNCYLLEGDTSALLIDSCWGVGDLYGVVKSITSKPLAIVATHLHPDHVGGAKQFGNYYVHEADLKFINKAMCCSLACYVGGRRIGSSEKHRKAKISRRIAIKDGYAFELGNRKLTVKNIPGHTKGSIMLIDEKYKLIFTGDDVNPNMWLQMPGAVSAEEWKTGAEIVLSYLQDGYFAWNGHFEGALSLNMANRVYALVNEIIDKYKKGQLQKSDSPYPNDQAMPNVRFRMDNILKSLND